MIECDKIKKYAEKLMFEIDECEYETVQKEFDVILQQMDLIGNIENIENVEPMVFPYDYEITQLRNDIDVSLVDNKTILRNAKETEGREVLVPKVVE